MKTIEEFQELLKLHDFMALIGYSLGHWYVILTSQRGSKLTYRGYGQTFIEALNNAVAAIHSQ